MIEFLTVYTAIRYILQPLASGYELMGDIWQVIDNDDQWSIYALTVEFFAYFQRTLVGNVLTSNH